MIINLPVFFFTSGRTKYRERELSREREGERMREIFFYVYRYKTDKTRNYFVYLSKQLNKLILML